MVIWEDEVTIWEVTICATGLIQKHKRNNEKYQNIKKHRTIKKNYYLFKNI